MRKIVKIILVIAIAIFIISFFQKNRLPDKGEIVEQLYKEPIQITTDKPEFKIEKGGIIYNIKPLYSYELYGLIISQHHSEGWFDYYHKKWDDFLNIKDLCVIWGDNIKSEIYQKMKFKSGSYTCYWEFQSKTNSNDWAKFNHSRISNNHLLSDNKKMNKIIMKAEEGDQIYFKGYLVEYSHGEDFKRGTSITRTDTGRSCETIYITDFKIIKKGNLLWRYLYFLSKYLIIICLLVWLIIFLKNPLGKSSK